MSGIVPETIHNFNNDSKSWKINAYHIKSISGDDLVFEVSGNNKMVFYEEDISYTICDFINLNSLTADLTTANPTVRIPISYNNYAIAEPNTLTTKLTLSGDWIDLSDSGYSINYTPSTANSKIYLHFKINYISSTQAEQLISFRLKRDISGGTAGDILFTDTSLGTLMGVMNTGIYNLDYIDSPNTTEQTTYYIYYQIQSNDTDIDISCGVIGYDVSAINFMMAQELYVPATNSYNSKNCGCGKGSATLDNYSDASLGNVDISGKLVAVGLTAGAQVKALYYNTTTGEITYDNSGGGGTATLDTYSDASLGDVDISAKLQVNNITSISGNDLTIQTSGNDKIVFIENDASYNIANFLGAAITMSSYSFVSPSTLQTNLTLSGDWVDLSASGYTMNYTPSNSSSSIHLRAKINYINSIDSEQLISFRLVRIILGESTPTILFTDCSLGAITGIRNNDIYTIDYLDTPNTTNQITYYIKYQIQSTAADIDTSSGVIGYDVSAINFMMAQEILPLGYSAYNTTTLDASFRNLDITGTFNLTSLTESAQVKALYYNTTTGEVTYDNSGGGGTATLDTYSDASFGYVDISGTLKGKTSNNQLALGSHIIPTANAQFDLGSAEYKIRHLFLSDNSLYVGPSDENTAKKVISKNSRNEIQFNGDISSDFIYTNDLSVNKNLDISDNLTVGGSFKITGLTNAPQVKALYYNTTTGEITYDNSGSDVELNTYSDASLGDVDISATLQVNHITSISGNDLTIEASGNNKIVFLENDISYNLANFVTATTTTPSEIFYCAKSADSTIADGNTVDITNLNNSNSFRISSGGNNIFDQTTGIFTCQVAGIYQITCKLQIKESAFVLRIGGLYRANSSAGWSTFTKAYDVLPSATGSDRDSESVSVYKQLSVGNQIKFQAYHASQGGNSADMRGHNTEDLTIVMGHKMETTESIPANITTTTSPSELFYCAKSSNQNMNFTEDNWGAYNDITGLDNNNSFRISSGGNNIFDQSTGIFTCQVAGVYFISCKIQLAGWHEEINLSAYFRSSSSDSWPVDNAYFAEHTSYEYGSGGSDDTPTYKRTETLSCYKQLAVGNQIKFATRIFASHGGTKTLYGSSDQDRTVIYGHKMETAVTVTNDILQAYNDASFDYVDISAKLQVNNIISLPDQDTSSVFGKAVVGTQGSYGVFGNYTAQATSTLWCIRQANSGETHIQGNGVEGLRFFNSHASTSNELWIIGGQGAGNGGAGDDGAFLARTQSHNIYARKMYHTVSNTNNSDDRIKHNEVDISGLEIIRQLKPQKYQKTKLKYPADYRGDISGEWNWETGLIAQDILKINDISYCATVNNYLDMYGLTYNDIFVYGLQATKELDITVQEQQNTINSLQTELNTVKTALNTLLTAAGQNTI